MNQPTQTPIQATITWLRAQVEKTLLDLKQAKRSKNQKDIAFCETRLAELGRKILHVDLQIDQLQPVA